MLDTPEPTRINRATGFHSYPMYRVLGVFNNPISQEGYTMEPITKRKLSKIIPDLDLEKIIIVVLDAYWHLMDKGKIEKVTEFYNARKAVKDKYPKPEVAR